MRGRQRIMHGQEHHAGGYVDFGLGRAIAVRTGDELCYWADSTDLVAWLRCGWHTATACVNKNSVRSCRITINGSGHLNKKSVACSCGDNAADGYSCSLNRRSIAR